MSLQCSSDLNITDMKKYINHFTKGKDLSKEQYISLVTTLRLVNKERNIDKLQNSNTVIYRIAVGLDLKYFYS